jgi:hypothetical protein
MWYFSCAALWVAGLTSLGCARHETPVAFDAGARDASAHDLDGSEPDASSPVSDAAAAHSTLARGTCGVLQQFTLPDPIESIYRAPRGFIARQYDSDGAWFTWLALSEAGEHAVHFRKANPHSSTIALLPMGPDPFNGTAVLVYWGELASSGMRSVWAEAIDSANPHPLGEGFARGTMAQAHAVSFDGRRAVHATGHIATDVPHAFLFAADGALVGVPVSLFDALHAATFECLSAHPTDTAAAVSVTDRSLELATWRLFEFSADGTVLRTVSLDATRFAGCPVVQRARGGFVIGIGTLDGVSLVYALNHSAEPELYARVTFSDAASLHAVVELPDGSIALLQRNAAGSTRMDRIDADGSLTSPSGELPAIGEVIPAEAGRVFALGPIDVNNAPRTLYELGCGAQ